jgi:hypothetical protein
MDGKDFILLAVGAVLGYYVVAHKMKTGKSA